MEKEKERALELAREVEHDKAKLAEQNEVIEETIAQINQHFVGLYQSLDDMSKGNENNAEESTGISMEVLNVSNFCERLNDSMKEIQDLINELGENNAEVVSTADQVKALLNNLKSE